MGLLPVGVDRSKSVEPGVAEYLQVRFGDTGFQSRKIDFGDYDDPIEMCFERGWIAGRNRNELQPVTREIKP